MVFKLYDCDIGFTYNGVNYDFDHIDSVEVNDPERTRLTRGNNAGNKIGISYKEGLKDAKVITIPVIAVPKAIHDLLKQIYAAAARLDVYIIARSDGSSKIAKNAVLAAEPQQLTLDDSAESLNMSLVFETFDMNEIHKS